MKRSKRQRRVLALLCAVVILFLGRPDVYAISEQKDVQQKLLDQQMAVDANEALMQYFFDNGWVTEYPDYYGGGYIEDNVFNIRLVTPTDQTMGILDKIFEPYKDAVAYELCDMSQKDAQAYADETAKALIADGYAVTHWYTDDVTGNVVIGVQDADIQEVKKQVTHIQKNSKGTYVPTIIVEEGGYLSNEAVLVLGGDRMWTGSYHLSIGVCGEYNGYKAFVTCGHGGLSVGTNITSNGNTIGTIARVQYESGEAGDFAIGVLSASGEATHKMRSNNNSILTLTNGTYLSPLAGTNITKYGAATGYSVGTVLSTNFTILDEAGKMVTGLTRAKITNGASADGDSGGPYLTGNAFCGVHKGSYTDGDGGLICCFTPYSVIASAGFTAYGSHKCSAWFDNNATNHQGFCTICQDDVYEEHAKYWNHSLGLCRRCGRTGSIMT